MPGRNDPCPCGSGKKFKKCCIDGASALLPPGVRFVARPSSREAPTRRQRIGHFTVEAARAILDDLPGTRELQISPWVRARLQDQLRPPRAGSPAAHSHGSVRAMPTSELLAFSAAAGGPVSADAFEEAASGAWSACDLVAMWSGSSRATEPLLALVAVELWRRVLPEYPSLEMVDEALDVGFTHFDAGDVLGAVTVWTSMVHDLGDILPQDVVSLSDADTRLCGLELLTNWISEIGTNLHNAVLFDPSLVVPVTGLYQAVRARFSEERYDMTLVIADLADASGASAVAVAMYEQLLARDPDDVEAASALSRVRLRVEARSDARSSLAAPSPPAPSPHGRPSP